MHGSLETLTIEVDLCVPGWERIVDRNPPVEIIARDIIFGEGPVWDARGKQLYFTDIIGDTIWKWRPGKGLEAVMMPSVKADGLALDLEYRVVVAGWGGRTVWLYAAHNPALKAGVAYYGLLAGMKSEIKPADPLDLAERVRAPVLGLYAGIDKYIPMEHVEPMRGRLARGGSGSEIVVFPGVNHGFNADYRPTYDKAAATYAQQLALDWLKDRGV